MSMTQDEPPFVAAWLARGAEHVSRLVKPAIRRAGRGPMLMLSGLAMLAILIAFVLQGATSVSGILRGVIAGLIAALVFGGAAAWTLMWAFAADKPADPDRARVDRAESLEQALAPTLRELRAVRAEMGRQARIRSLLRVPLGIAGAAVAWALLQWSSDPPGLVALVVFGFVGALLGEGWAVGALDREYRRDLQGPRAAAARGAVWRLDVPTCND